MRGEERRGEGERGRGRKTDWSESSAEGVEREVLSSVRKHEISRHRGGCKNILSGSRKASGALVGGGGGGLVAAPEKARLRLRLPSLTSLSSPPPRLFPTERTPPLQGGWIPWWSRARRIFHRISPSSLLLENILIIARA